MKGQNHQNLIFIVNFETFINDFHFLKHFVSKNRYYFCQLVRKSTQVHTTKTLFDYVKLLSKNLFFCWLCITVTAQ